MFPQSRLRTASKVQGKCSKHFPSVGYLMFRPRMLSWTQHFVDVLFLSLPLVKQEVITGQKSNRDKIVVATEKIARK